MPNYRRIFIPGGDYFFTVNLLDRRRSLLTDNIDILRGADGCGQARHPFETVAICILPEHLPCVWRSPPEDWPYSTYHKWKKQFGRPINVPPKDWNPVHLGER